VIRFVSVAKSFPDEQDELKPVLRPTTISLPADRRVGLLSEEGAGKSVVLQLIAGALEPDEGRVMAPLQLSPILNFGPLFHPQLSCFENIRFIARAFGADPTRLAMAAEAFAGLPGLLTMPARSLDSEVRRSLEAAVTMILPFDCYLFDNIGQLPPEMAERCFDAAAQRRCGVIFATSNARRARQLGDFIVVIRDQTLYPFEQPEEAIRFYERK
jgi:capsular polysaccharide transport system ATP-binding protein